MKNIYSDDLYGEFELEDVLCRLIESAPIQRLKGVMQGGASYLVCPEWNVTRYEHSLGVMLLIRRLGGSLEEQIAGLLHDVSHTAFSHVVDTVLKRSEEDYHEEIFHTVIEDSEIPSLLQDYGYSTDLLNGDFFILEQNLPDLCADRIDYTLRDMYQQGKITKDETLAFLRSLSVHEGKLYVRSLEDARWFVETYYKEVIDYFLHPLNVYSYEALSSILKRALECKIITMPDFLLDDAGLLQKVQKHGDEEIQRAVNELMNFSGELEETEDDYEIHRISKLRLIDPLVMQEGRLERASVLSEEIHLVNQAARERATKGVYLRVKVI
ncbi:HD domain-containing protein [Fictibacillus enclensis]|uniref:HD domain-containing protein n=1 Tax=Fictibacillus enclensis TaxID=1017270 RepID=UPI0024BF4352|nr:HD domain-containing protein [Fictibacillus enclensis]WHY72312.1 HD domain-containing protein [Fictibacillus enclensis]